MLMSRPSMPWAAHIQHKATQFPSTIHSGVEFVSVNGSGAPRNQIAVEGPVVELYPGWLESSGVLDVTSDATLQLERTS